MNLAEPFTLLIHLMLPDNQKGQVLVLGPEPTEGMNVGGTEATRGLARPRNPRELTANTLAAGSVLHTPLGCI